MTRPTHQDVLQQLAATRDADQKARLDLLLAARWGLLVGGALMLPALVVAVGVAR